MIAAAQRAAAPACGICGHDAGRLIPAREMMLGLGDTFTYRECVGCGCLELADPPADLGRYYPDRYYSFADRDDGLPSWSLTMGDLLAAAVVARAAGRALSRRELAERAVADYLTPFGVDTGWRILDVGCGGGGLLADLAGLGFGRLLGLDPYLDRDREVAPGVRVVRGGLDDVEPGWDLVMLNHSFEHLAEPGRALRRVEEVLAPAGVVLIRTPLVPCEAWERFGPCWMQLDAPRHLFVHSLPSLRRLAGQAGLEVRRVVYDSGFLSPLLSEQYRRGVPMLDPRSFVVDPAAGPPPAAIGALIHRARLLNAQGRGDQAAVVLARPPGRAA